MRKTFTALTALLMVTVVVQFFLAGGGAFDPAPPDESFGLHRTLGYVIVLGAVVLALVGALARLPGRLIGMAGLVVGLTLLQPVIAGIAGAVGESDGSTTSAGELVFGLHAVNALIIMGVLGTIIRASRELSTASTAAASKAAEPAS